VPGVAEVEYDAPMRRGAFAISALLVVLLITLLFVPLRRSRSMPGRLEPLPAAAAQRPSSGLPVEIEFAIVRVPGGARSQVAVQKLLEGLGSEVTAVAPERAKSLADQLRLAIAPASASVLSRSRVVLLSGTSAEVGIAENVPIGSGAGAVRGNLALRVTPELRPDGSTELDLSLSMSRAEGAVRVALDSAGLPGAKHASGAGHAEVPAGGCAAFTRALGSDEVLVIATPRPRSKQRQHDSPAGTQQHGPNERP
jgi:hypothetical protein